MDANVVWFADLTMADVDRVGGKNASLGELVGGLAAAGVRVPDGFATTAGAFRRFLAADDLATRIDAELAELDVEDTVALTEVGSRIRSLVENQQFPSDLEADIRQAYEQLAGQDAGSTFAIRSSATAEDLPDASFAGQQE